MAPAIRPSMEISLMSKTYRAAVVGCGGMSHSHASQYHRLENVELAACADIRQEAMDAYEERYGVKAHYTDYQKMLENEGIDLVSVCTWIPLHGPIAIAAAEAGAKGIICEKPMSDTLKEADEMIAAADANGTKLAVGHQLRFHAPYTGVAALLEGGAVGDVTHIHGHCRGGDLMDNATHTVDLMRWFAGDAPAEWIMGQINRGGAGERFGIPIVQDSIGYWKHNNGIWGFIEAGSVARGGYHHIFIYGTDGEMELSRPGGPAIRYRSPQTGGEWETPHTERDSAPVADLIDAIENDRDPRSSGRNGRAVLELLLGIMESSRLHRRLGCPLELDHYPLQTMLEDGDV